MKAAFRSVPAVALLLLSSGCRDNLPVERVDRSASTDEHIVRVVFTLPGDDIGGPEYQDIMDRIRKAIREDDAGEVMGFGFGMGTMEISVEVDDDGGAERIDRIIRESYPRGKYRIKDGTGGEASQSPGAENE